MHETADAIEVVGVVGAGVIGASWAALFLAAGREVDVFDPAPAAEADTRAYVERAWPALEAIGLVRPGASADRMRFAAGFLERYRGSFEAWWASLGAPALDADTARLLGEGVAVEACGRSLEELGAERDARLVAALRALRDRSVHR